jgi:2,4-dienoyl-CoA reductase-like NADH-dependent reductase (Old Yellow Enzyme family)
VPPDFVLAVKLNAADYVEGGMTEDQSLEHVRTIAKWKLFDTIEISGGDYENLGMQTVPLVPIHYANFFFPILDIFRIHQVKQATSFLF